MVANTNHSESNKEVRGLPLIIAIIAIIAIALTKACPIRWHTLASDSTRGRRDLPFDRGALPKRYVGVSRTLPRRLGAIGTRWCPPCRGFRRSALRVVAPNHRMTCESPDFTVLALAFARDSNRIVDSPPGRGTIDPSNIFHRLRRTFSVARCCSLRPCDVCFHSSPGLPGPRALSCTARASPPHPPYPPLSTVAACLSGCSSWPSS